MITIGINDQEVFTLLRQLEARGENMAPVMMEIEVIMEGAVRDNFEREGRPSWPALKPATIISREKRGHWPGKMLQVGKDVWRSWTSTSDRTRAVVGTNYKVAIYQELGTRRMPARPVRKLTARDIGEVKLVLMNYLFKPR